MSRLVWTRAAAALTSSSSPVTVFVPTSCSPRPSGPEDDEDASSVAHSASISRHDGMISITITLVVVNIPGRNGGPGMIISPSPMFLVRLGGTA